MKNIQILQISDGHVLALGDLIKTHVLNLGCDLSGRDVNISHS